MYAHTPTATKLGNDYEGGDYEVLWEQGGERLNSLFG